MKPEDVEVGKTYRFTVEGRVFSKNDSFAEVRLQNKGDEGRTSWLVYPAIQDVLEIDALPVEPSVGSKVRRIFNDKSGSDWVRYDDGWVLVRSFGTGYDDIYASKSKYLSKWRDVIPTGKGKLFLVETRERTTPLS